MARAISKLVQFTQTNHPSELERAGIIQAFEFTCEIMWKAFKEVAEEEGILAASPKSACKAAFQLGVIQEEAIWLSIITDRNLTSHTYIEEVAQKIYLRIRDQYAAAMESTAQFLLK